MKGVIFHSLYTDPGLDALKHAIFYFGKVSIPEQDFVFLLPDPVDGGPIGPAVVGGNVAYGDHVTLIPEHMYPHVEFLEKEGMVERLTFLADEKGAADPRRLSELIVEVGNRSGRQRTYRPWDVAPLFSFLRLYPDHPATHELIEQLAIMIVALCLGGVAQGKGLPCVDNLFIFDLVNFGLQGIFESFLDGSDFSTKEIQSLKAQYLGQVVSSLFLPSFSFRSFDDVLELREHFKDRLTALRGELLEASSDLEGMPWEPRFHSALVAKLESKIVPEINALRDAARFSPMNVARSMGTAGVVVALKMMLPKWVSEWVIGGTALPLVAAIKKERERVRQTYLESSFSILLQVPK
jgi:hypothetical protein